MKRYMQLSCALVIPFLIGCSFPFRGNSNSFPQPQPLFHKDDIVENRVKTLFNHLGQTVTSLEEANTLAQKKCLRTGERWDTQQENDLQKKMHTCKNLLINDLRAFGMIDKIDPKQKDYTYALLMGSLKNNTAKRMDYLAELFQNGYQFSHIVLLGGDRPLRDIEKEGLPDSIKTEADMMEYLCKTHPVLKSIPTIMVRAPMIQKADGTTARPTTDDTLRYFVKLAPYPGSCLVISNNPYVVRQTKVAQRLLDQSQFPTDGSGRAYQEGTIDIVMLMDEFARTLYEEYKQSQH